MLVLNDMPSFAIQEAARRIISGEAGISRTFAPTPAEMRSVACEIRAPAKWRAKQLELLLAAKVEREISAEERANVVKRLNDIISGIGTDKGAS